MSDDRYFEKALHNFTMDAASLGAVRHLADLGMTVKQIEEHLDFPTPHEMVRQTVWEELTQNGTILLTEPTGKQHQEHVRFVREYGRYGKATFRRVTERKDTVILPEDYLSCDFGLFSEEERLRRMKRAGFSSGEIEYVEGLPWIRQIVYHKRDERMERITEKWQSI